MDSNSFAEWDKKWDKRFKSGWIKTKKKYRLLRVLFPKLALRMSPRKDYYLGVAKLVDGKFCDIGCGIGAVAGIYAMLSGKKSYGIDQSLTAMKHASKESLYFGVSCAFSVGNIYKVGIKNGAFDTVYLGQILEHLEDEKGALDEAMRLLRPGGKLIVSVPVEGRIPDDDHVREYTKESLRELLENMKLENIAFHDVDPRRFVVTSLVKE